MVRTDTLFGLDFVPLPRLAAESETAPRDATGGDRIGGSDGADRASFLDQLRERHERECPHCTSATFHSQTVFGEGNPDARLVFVGEAPGAEEDRTGRPFVGRAGQLLDKMIAAMGLKREDVYICNVLKARPPDNATPTPAEADKCGPYLAEQLRIIRPRAIVALGAPAAKYLLRTTEGISRLRGSWHLCRLGDLDIPVMPTFHPAFLLRQYTPENRAYVWSDLQKVMQKLNEEG